MILDRNKTIHQRIAQVVTPLVGKEQAEVLAKLLRPYVIAERHDAAREKETQ